MTASILDNLPETIERARHEAGQGCGGSDVLYFSRFNDCCAGILKRTPEHERERVEAELRAAGFDPDAEEQDFGEGVCDLTGIEEFCCPCGRHP